MKKSLALIAAVALVFAGCTDKDIIRKDINESKGDSNGAITFNAFAEKVTRAENSTALYNQTFYNHQESFQVWARKSNQPNQEIFDGARVNVEKSGNTYTYTYAPERFWDKLAPKYHFYAAAPARTTSDDWYWTFNGEDIEDAATIGEGYFSIAKDFTLNEVNLKHKDNGGADYALEKVFKNIPVSSTNTKKDVDLLIAAPAEVAQSYYNVANPNAVNLNFIHILSKLNVTVKTSLGTVTPTDGSAAHTYSVKVLAFEVKNVPNVGKFNESPNNLATNNKKQIRWALTTPATKNTNILTGIDNALTVPYNPTEAQKLYIVESLFVPQEIKYQRVALDGAAHDIIDLNEAKPYASYEAYEEAKNNDVDRLTEVQFNALIDGESFVAWDNYDHLSVPGETDDKRITEATFNSRIAQATKEGTTPYSNYTEFSQAKVTLTADQFNALLTNEGAFVSFADYTQLDGDNIDETTFNNRVAQATKQVVKPYANYAEYSEAKSGTPELSQDQFNALIDNGAFVSWADYSPLAAEGEATFNARVADATKETVETPYSDYTEYSQAKVTLTQEQFNALIDNGSLVDYEYYLEHANVTGETNSRIDRDTYNDRVAEATKTPVTLIPAYSEPSEPYFTITYSIDNELFTASYNLAAAFMNLDNNQFESDGVTEKDAKFSFYEGWQNTLNITINPTAIEFTADVAEWATNEDVDFTVENGNY